MLTVTYMCNTDVYIFKIKKKLITKNMNPF